MATEISNDKEAAVNYPLLKLLMALGLPLAVFLAGGSWMMKVTGRGNFPETAAPESTPLHFRFGGYDVAEVRAYWDWLGADGRLAELRFLELDLLFPLFYGGAILLGLFLIWDALGRPFPRRRLTAPVFVNLIADWTENLTLRHQLRRFLDNEPIEEGWIALAGQATTVKILCFSLAWLLLLGLILRWLRRLPEEATR